MISQHGVPSSVFASLYRTSPAIASLVFHESPIKSRRKIVKNDEVV
jgi:hypothetical protein